MSQREITLNYNGFNIPIKITDNYEETMKIIREKLYFREIDLKKYQIFYFDDEDNVNFLSEDDYDYAFSDEEIKRWGLLRLTKEFEKIQEELISKFEKIANEKITANNKKYEERIKKLEQIIKALKEKNKNDEVDISQSMFEKTQLIDSETKLNNTDSKIENLENEETELINKLKMNTNIDENIICILFKSLDENIDLALPCKKTDIFVKLEEELYKQFPEYKGTDNYFTVNGIEIKRDKSLEENKIKNSDTIILNKKK